MGGVKPVKGFLIFSAFFILNLLAFLLFSSDMVMIKMIMIVWNGDLPLEESVVEDPVDGGGSTESTPHLFEIVLILPFSFHFK